MDHDELKDFVKEMKDQGIPDHEIYDFLDKQGEFKEFRDDVAGSSTKKEQDKFLAQQLELNPVRPRTLAQEAMVTLAGPLPWIGEKLGIQSLEDIKALPGTAAASITALPRTMMDFPHDLMKSQAEWLGKPELGEFAPPALSNLLNLPGLPDLRPPDMEQTKDFFVREQDRPKSDIGKLAERVTEFAGPGALTGGIGTLIGAGLGAVDYGLEKAERSPYERVLPGLLLGGGKAAKDKISKSRKGKPPPPPGSTRDQITAWGSKVLDDFKDKQINDASDLAAKILIRDPDKINLQAVEALNSLGIPIEEVPVQAYTKGGMANLIEGAAENSFFSRKRFNGLITKFSNDMINRFDAMLDAFPPQEITEKVTSESLGEPIFSNPLKETVEQLNPGMDLSKAEIGRSGIDHITSIDETMRANAKAAYEEAKFTEQDFISPDSMAYRILEDAADTVLAEAEGKGYTGPRQQVVEIAKKFKELFKTKKKKGAPEIILPNGEKAAPKKPNILYDDLRKNLVALNDKLNYDNPEMINLAMPLANAIREVFQIEATQNPKAQAFIQAQEIFGNRANLFNDPTMRKISRMSPEQLFSAMKKPTILEALDNFAVETGSEAQVAALKNAFLAKFLERALNAENAQELNSSITTTMLDTAREIQDYFPELEGLRGGLQEAKKFANEWKNNEGQVQGKIRQEAIEFSLTGEKPSFIFTTMDDPKGVRQVKDALTGTEVGKQLYNNIVRKKLEQVLYKDLGKEAVTIQELSKILDNQDNRTSLKALLTSEEYKKLEDLVKVLKSLKEGKEAGLFLKRKAEYGSLGALIGSSLAAPFLPGFGAGTAGVVALNGIARAIISDRFRKSAGQRVKDITDQ